MNTRDEISRMTPLHAAKVREQYEKQLHYQREKLIFLKKRKEKMMSRLDEEIKKIEADISLSQSVIEAIDESHFNTITNSIPEEVFDEVF